MIPFGSLLLLLAAACADSTAPRPTETFAVQATSATYPPATPTVQATASSVTVDGIIATATPCYSISGSTSTARDTLVVQVTGRQTGNGACVQMIGMWRYTLTVHPRPGGVDAIRVVHDGGIGQPVVALQAPLAP
jgi:hypothetical protein